MFLLNVNEFPAKLKPSRAIMSRSVMALVKDEKLILGAVHFVYCQLSAKLVVCMGACHYAKLTGQRLVEYLPLFFSFFQFAN